VHSRVNVCRLALLLLGAVDSFGQTDVWNAISGNWSSRSKWTDGRPANNGLADVGFDLGSTFSSNVNRNWAINSLTIGSGAGSFTLTGTVRSGSRHAALTIGNSLTDMSAHEALIEVSLLGTMSLNLLGSGTLTLAGINLYTGGTTLTSGTLADEVKNAFSHSSAFKVGSGATLDVNFAEIISSLSDNSGGGTVDIAEGATLTMDGSHSGTFSGVLTGAGGIQLDGANVLTLTGSNSYGGATVIGSGSTIVAGNNNALGSSSVTLGGGATLNVMNGVTISNPLITSGSTNVLSGGGKIGSSFTVGSAVIVSPRASPGNGPGDLTFTSGLTLASGGTIDFGIYNATGAAGTGYSLISANGGLNMSSASANSITFDLVSIGASGNASPAINFNPANSYSWMFATSSSAIVGFAPNQFNLVATGFGNLTNGGVFSFSESGDSLFLNFTPVPEPSTWSMLAMGLFAVVPFVLHGRHFLRGRGETFREYHDLR